VAAYARIGFCLGMSKTFRPWRIDQPLLLPARVQDFVGEDHLAVSSLRLCLRTSTLARSNRVIRARGQPPFDPAMMTALLLRKRHLKTLAGLFGGRFCNCASRLGWRSLHARWHKDQGERLEAQGDELRAHGQACGGARSRGRAIAERRRGGRRRGGQGVRARQERRGTARLDRRQHAMRTLRPEREFPIAQSSIVRDAKRL